MPHSMTGFATANVAVAPFTLTWELRSVNHRFLDLSFRLPEELRPLEPTCRDRVTAALKRGKLDCTLKITVAEPGGQGLEVMETALTALRGLSERVRGLFPEARPLAVSEVLRWPGVLREPQQELAALEQPTLACLEEALTSLLEARRREGTRTAELLEQRAAGVMALVEAIKPRIPTMEARYREKLEERLKRLDVQADPERLEQELVLVAQRLDVAEEVDRLAGHVTEIRDVLGREEAIGRRLDFLIQELHREANTLSSKAQDEDLIRHAVDLKVLIEQMREQVQNLE
jgi:uncharacterized protein (TIGR00255 family)